MIAANGSAPDPERQGYASLTRCAYRSAGTASSRSPRRWRAAGDPSAPALDDFRQTAASTLSVSTCRCPSRSCWGEYGRDSVRTVRDTSGFSPDYTFHGAELSVSDLTRSVAKTALMRAAPAY